VIGLSHISTYQSAFVPFSGTFPARSERPHLDSPSASRWETHGKLFEWVNVPQTTPRFEMCGSTGQWGKWESGRKDAPGFTRDYQKLSHKADGDRNNFRCEAKWPAMSEWVITQNIIITYDRSPQHAAVSSVSERLDDKFHGGRTWLMRVKRRPSKNPTWHCMGICNGR
jgi:hypothetical protein